MILVKWKTVIILGIFRKVKLLGENAKKSEYLIKNKKKCKNLKNTC